MRLLNLLRYGWTHPLNANRRLAALVRVIRWQIGRCSVLGPVALPFVDTPRLLATDGITGAARGLRGSLHEHCEMEFVLQST